MPTFWFHIPLSKLQAYNEYKKGKENGDISFFGMHKVQEYITVNNGIVFSIELTTTHLSFFIDELRERGLLYGS